MEPNDMSHEIVNEIERDKIIQFCSDKLLYEAVKKYILAVLYKQGVVEKGRPHNARINWAMNLSWGAADGKGLPRSDEELGQNLRAMTLAVQLVESGFSELAEMRKPVLLQEETVNQAE